MSACLSYSPEQLLEKLEKVQAPSPLCRYDLARCEVLAPLVNRILELKAEKNAIVLAHTYVHPDILYTVADFVGDSYGLSQAARHTDASAIAFPAVRFMAETAKILNPEKMVIDPNPRGGCSLADSISAEQVKQLRKQHPEHTFVCYVNTTAEVKAECDVCVTSSNANRILEKLPTDKIYFLPDRLLGQNAKSWLESKKIRKEVLLYPGTCYVHEEIRAEDVERIRAANEGTIVIAHPECQPEVVAKADYVGSTTDMQRIVAETKGQNRPYLLLSECGVATRVATEISGVSLVGGCSLCQFMRGNSLQTLKESLENPKQGQIIEIDPEIRKRAYKTLERMFDYAG